MEEILLFGDSLADTRAGCSKSKFERVFDPYDSKWNSLNEIPQWRKCLSSLHSHQTIEIDGLQFSTPEHFFNFKKFETVDSEYSGNFVLNGQFGLLTGKQARQKGKSYRLTPEQWNHWKNIEPHCKEKARASKFVRGNQCYQTLVSTHEAQLWSYAPRCSTFRMTTMEQIRNQLINQSI